MINKSLFDTLVPDAPLYRRTDADQPVTVGLELAGTRAGC